LVFPANGNVGYQTDNNFPAGTSFRSITMTSQAIGQTAIKGWHHGGHAISLQRSMTFLTTGAFAPFSTINFPVTLADDVTFYLEADGVTWGSGFGDSVLDLADHTLTFQNAPVALSGGINFYDAIQGDRKSTRLNSSHVSISYAV